jgi:hypothetical protein
MLARQQHPTKASLLALLSGAGPEHPSGTVCDGCGKRPSRLACIL